MANLAQWRPGSPVAPGRERAVLHRRGSYPHGCIGEDGGRLRGWRSRLSLPAVVRSPVGRLWRGVCPRTRRPAVPHHRSHAERRSVAHRQPQLDTFRRWPLRGRRPVIARLGNLTFDSARRLVTTDNGVVLHLTPKAFDLLRLLIEHAPHVVTKAAIHQRLWK